MDTNGSFILSIHGFSLHNKSDTTKQFVQNLYKISLVSLSAFCDNTVLGLILYIVCQIFISTLILFEQVFINFAKQQTELLDDEMEAAKVTSSSKGRSGAGTTSYDVAFRNTRGENVILKILQM